MDKLNIAAIKKAGAHAGADLESAVNGAGESLQASVLALWRQFPKGKGIAYATAYWLAFDGSAPNVKGLKRVKVTRSESMRIARGIDSGLETAAGSWKELLKVAPKATAGKGAGGGRKPRAPDGTADKAGPGKTAAPTAERSGPDAAPVPPIVGLKQLAAGMVAYCHQHKAGLPIKGLDAVAAMSAILTGLPND